MAEVNGQDVVNYLMQFKGTPYVWGGTSPNGFDCSGLLQYGFSHFGISIPRVTNDQIGSGKAVDWDEMQVGDAIFFDTDTDRSGPDHVGIYIGNGKMLQAPKTGDVVKITDITSGYYAQRFMGARRFNGVQGGGDSNTDWKSQSPIEKKLSPEEMAANYGLSWAFLNSDSSLKKVFEDAVKGSWTADKFQAEMKNTDFWKQNSESARKALEMKSSDPATWQATIEASKVKIQQRAGELGASIPASALDKMANDFSSNAMNDEQLNSILSGYIDYVGNSMSGMAGQHEQVMRKYASDMGVDVNQQSIKNYAQLMIKGMSSQQDFKNFIDGQATSSFPAFQDQIKSGQTIRDIANPYIQMMAQTFNMNPSAITMKDPTIMSALNGVDKNGVPTGKTLSEFGDTLRGDPRWRTTDEAMTKTMSTANRILQNWGLV
jgi:hypothetical protein